MLIIERLKNRPAATGITAYVLDALDAIVKALRGLITLDSDVRQTRTTLAERAVLFVSAIVTNAAVTQMQDIAPRTVTEDFTTALICFDATAGAGRYRFDGPFPTPASATAAAGLPIPALGFIITITGSLNIRSFAVTAETATNMNMSILLFK